MTTWWRHVMETISTLLALCDGNPPITGGFPSHVTNNAKLWSFLCNNVFKKQPSSGYLRRHDAQGAVSIRKTVLLGMVIPMLKIRRPTGRLIFNMGIPIPGKTVFYIETGPWSQQWFRLSGNHLLRQGDTPISNKAWTIGLNWCHIYIYIYIESCFVVRVRSM